MMDDQFSSDGRVTRQTVAHLQTLAIEQSKRIAEIERHVRDIKFAVVLLIPLILAIVYQLAGWIPGKYHL
jgi:hypothetical protein